MTNRTKVKETQIKYKRYLITGRNKVKQTQIKNKWYQKPADLG